MNLEGHLRNIAEQLVHELEPIVKIKEVTSNSDLLGLYTEAATRRLIARTVHPLRVSAGAVLDYPPPERLRQIDAIIWTAFPVPGIFEVGGFALVPRSSAFGVLEIKRSNYSEVDAQLEEFGKAAENLVMGLPGPEETAVSLGMGVVCVLTEPPSRRLQALLDNDVAVAIFDATDPDRAIVRANDVLRLINFLQRVRWLYNQWAKDEKCVQVMIGTKL